MVIDKIGGINPSYGPRRSEPATKNEKASRPMDNITISEEATRASEASKIARLASRSDETERSEKIKTIKDRLQNGEYDQLNEEVLSKIADSVVSSMLERN